MGNYLIQEDTLQSIADGARNAIGTYDEMTPSEMAERLADVRDIDRERVTVMQPYEDEWVRPNDWPDLDTLLDDDPADDVIYLTYDTDAECNAIAWHIETQDKQPATIEIGHVEGGAFAADFTDSVEHNTNYGRWLDDLSGLVVVRITGMLTRCYTYSWTDSGRTVTYGHQVFLQRAARIPHLTAFSTDYRYYGWASAYLVRDRVDNGDGSALTSLGVAWYVATSLRSLDISRLRTQNVTSMARTFTQCVLLTELDISHLDTSKVTSLASAFGHMKSLRELDLSQNDFSNVTDWSYAVYETVLTEVSLPAVARPSTMTYMFYNCYDLRAIDISTWDLSNVSNMAYAFDGCTSLEEVRLPETGPYPTTCAYMLYNCMNIRQIDLSAWDLSRCTNFAYMFNQCRSLRTVAFPDTDNTVATSVQCMFDGCWNLMHVDLSWLKLTVVTNICYMFRECNALRELDLPAWDLTHVTSSNNYSHSLFFDCYSLQRITGIKDWHFTHTNSIGNMFYNCHSLRELDVSGWDVSTVSTIGGMFVGCTSLRELDLSAWRPKRGISFNQLFNACPSLVTVGDLSGWDAQPTNTASMFASCCSMREFPDMTEWDMSLCTSTASMFANCWSLVEMDLHGLSMPKCTTVASMFNGCYALERLDVGGWSLPALNTAPATFVANCWDLKELVPSGFNLDTSYTGDYTLSHESLVAILEALPQVSTTRKLTLYSASFSILSDAEKQIATSKGWTVVSG